MPVETANSRYFRLQLDSLEYYKSKAARDAGGVAAAKGIFSFGDILTVRPATIEAELPLAEPAASSPSLFSSLSLPGPLAGITGGLSGPAPVVDDKCGLEIVMQPWYRSPNRVYKLRASDPSECMEWYRAIAGTLEQYAQFGAWADRDAAAKAGAFEELQKASVVSGASAKPLAAKFAPRFRVLRNAVVRKSFAAQSEQVDPLIVGSIVTAFELHLNEDGNPRIRCEGGWCNV